MITLNENENLNEPLINDALNIKQEFLNSKTNYSVLNINYKQIVIKLIDMGFSLEMIDMCFCFYNVNSIETAISLMTKENDVWQHKYIQSENKLCIICNELTDHIDYVVSDRISKIKEERESLNIRISKSLSNNNKSLGSSQSNEKLKEEIKEELKEENIDEIRIKISNNMIKCKVCECDFGIEELFSLHCDHMFCIDCWRYYLDQKIINSDVYNIQFNQVLGVTNELYDERMRRKVD